MAKRRILKRIIWTLIIVAVVGYLGVLGWFKYNESSLIYFPTKGLAAAPGKGFPEYHEVHITTADSVKLDCLEVPSQATDTAPFWILFFHGNGGNALSCRGHYSVLHNLGLNVLAVDYRGYGNSEGTPNETGLYRDADACYNYLRAVKNIPSNRIIIYGFSLGSAVAVDLATRRPAAGLILEGAFTSIPAIGQELYPIFPIKLLASQKFASLDKIDKVNMPKLFFHATDDHLIPINHGRALFEKASPPKRFIETIGGHNSAISNDVDKYRLNIAVFVEQVT